MAQKLIVAMQIGSIKNYNNIITKLSELNNNSNLFIISILTDISDQIFPIFEHQIISYHKNSGMDIGPFLLQLKELYKLDLSQYTHIYKVHTKSNEKWLNELMNIDLLTNKTLICSPKWLKPLDSFNRETIIDICHKFQIPNIYYDDHYEFVYDRNDIDIDFYSRYYNINISNKCPKDYNLNFILEHAKFNKYVLNESQIKNKKRKNVMFVAGTIFVIDIQLILKFFKDIDIETLYNMLEHEYTANDHPTYVHALERILSGFLC